MRTGINWLLICWLMCSACTDYTPKPRGYFRIEPDTAHYLPLPQYELPYSFLISHLVTVNLPPAGSPSGWINLSYPLLGATLYCSYLPITPSTFATAEAEGRLLVARQAKEAQSVRETAYSNPEQQVYGSLFTLDGASASPIQFMLTDSLSHFFRGTLYYDCAPNADSLAPVTRYLREDILELIQSFTWKR